MDDYFTVQLASNATDVNKNYCAPELRESRLIKNYNRSQFQSNRPKLSCIWPRLAQVHHVIYDSCSYFDLFICSYKLGRLTHVGDKMLERPSQWTELLYQLSNYMSIMQFPEIIRIR